MVLSVPGRGVGLGRGVGSGVGSGVGVLNPKQLRSNGWSEASRSTGRAKRTAA